MGGNFFVGKKRCAFVCSDEGVFDWLFEFTEMEFKNVY